MRTTHEISSKRTAADAYKFGIATSAAIVIGFTFLVHFSLGLHPCFLLGGIIGLFNLHFEYKNHSTYCTRNHTWNKIGYYRTFEDEGRGTPRIHWHSYKEIADAARRHGMWTWFWVSLLSGAILWMARYSWDSYFP